MHKKQKTKYLMTVANIIVVGGFVVSSLSGSANHALAQQSVQSLDDLPPVYGLLSYNEGGAPLVLSSIDARIVNDSLAWAQALNQFNYDFLLRGIEFPVYLEGRLIQNAAEFERAYRQWYALHALDDFREKTWNIQELSLVPIRVWRESLQDIELFDYQEQQIALVDDLGLNPDGYMFFIVYQHPENPSLLSSQGYYIGLDGTQPRLRGLM